MDERIVVVGGGLAGAAAALAAAPRGVLLVRAGPGATALSWGSLDVAGASPEAGGLPWRDPLRGEPLTPLERLGYLLRSRPAHPYCVLFPEREPERAASAVRQAAKQVLGLDVDLGASRLLGNVRGAVRVGDLALPEVAAGDLSRADSVALVDLPVYDARAAARALAADLAALGHPPPSIRVVRLALPEGLLGLEAPRLAAALDDPAAHALLARAVAPLGPGLVLFPPVLGLERTAEIARAVGAAELLGAPPWSPAGLRLDRRLLAALARAGVEVRQGRASAIAAAHGRASAVVVDGEPIPARAVVLATGRFTGGGLVERDARVREALLDLPVFDERGRRLDGEPARRALRRRYADPQPLFTAGVRVDGRLRPLDAAGRPALANLVACGELVGGFDPALQRTGLGFALLSGLRAGEEAARL